MQVNMYGAADAARKRLAEQTAQQGDQGDANHCTVKEFHSKISFGLKKATLHTSEIHLLKRRKLRRELIYWRTYGSNCVYCESELAEQTGQQGHQSDTDQGNAAASHQLFYPQLGVKLCSMAGGGVQKSIWCFLENRPGGTGQAVTCSTSGMGLRLK